jgi:MFS family permease
MPATVESPSRPTLNPPRKASLFSIFLTVCMDLVGFGMIIPLLALYGKSEGATAVQLGMLGASYSVMQFFFSPIWGRLSDRVGRRPILLMSQAGSTLAYLGFGFATLNHSYLGLLATRLLQGVFAANISAAQAYVADVTSPQDRAKGMGMIGAAFGVGFVLGPVLGGLTVGWGLAVPGFLASAICGFNWLLTFSRLPESLSPEIRERNQAKPARSYDPLNLARIRQAASHPTLLLLLAMFFINTFAFSNLEQTFSLLFLHKGFAVGAGDAQTADAAKKTGMVLAYVGIMAALIQGGLIRRLAPRFGEKKLLTMGLLLLGGSIAFLPLLPSYGLYFALMFPLAVGRSLVDPSISSLISKSADASDQGSTFGLSQGLASLARATGPFCGLITFEWHFVFPFFLAAGLTLVVFLLSFRLHKVP